MRRGDILVCMHEFYGLQRIPSLSRTHCTFRSTQTILILDGFEEDGFACHRMLVGGRIYDSADRYIEENTSLP